MERTAPYSPDHSNAILTSMKSDLMQNSIRNSPLFKATVIIAGVSAVISVGLLRDFPRGMLNNRLLTAAQQNNGDEIKFLLRAGADINYHDRDPYGSHAPVLMRAVESGDVETVKLLIEKGADVNAFNDAGETALIEAAGFGFSEMINILLNHGANINYHAKGGNTALEAAVLNVDIESTRMLLSRGADIHLGTPLLDACYDGNHFDKAEQIRLVKILIGKGAKVDARSESGYTALGMASYWDNDWLVEVLKNAGAVDNGKPVHLDPPAIE